MLTLPVPAGHEPYSEFGRSAPIARLFLHSLPPAASCASPSWRHRTQHLVFLPCWRRFSWRRGQVKSTILGWTNINPAIAFAIRSTTQYYVIWLIGVSTPLRLNFFIAFAIGSTTPLRIRTAASDPVLPLLFTSVASSSWSLDAYSLVRYI